MKLSPSGQHLHLGCLNSNLQLSWQKSYASQHAL
jgi:hypothetical protein